MRLALGCLSALTLVGAVDHVELWLNCRPIVDWTDPANHAADRAFKGMLALQVHRNELDWRIQSRLAGGFHRFRNVAIKEIN